MRANPLVTVLMPAYNAEDYLKDAIDSILNQTYSELEFLIINDGSADRTEEIILSYKDPRIRYIKNEVNLRYIPGKRKVYSPYGCR
jgi:glycosyltransferase involved in cell wall biosynthesis